MYEDVDALTRAPSSLSGGLVLGHSFQVSGSAPAPRRARASSSVCDARMPWRPASPAARSWCVRANRTPLAYSPPRCPWTRRWSLQSRPDRAQRRHAGADTRRQPRARRRRLRARPRTLSQLWARSRALDVANGGHRGTCCQCGRWHPHQIPVETFSRTHAAVQHASLSVGRSLLAPG